MPSIWPVLAGTLMLVFMNNYAQKAFNYQVLLLYFSETGHQIIGKEKRID